jgi:hypothetical protein
MKCYIGEIETYFGESEVSDMIRFKTDDDPSKYLDNIASTFWGDTPERDFDTGLYNFGDRMAGVGHWQEVDADTYKKLKIIKELNAGGMI